MIDYLQPKDGAVLPGEERREKIYAEDQPAYKPLRTLKSLGADGAVLSRWSPTEEQRKAIAEGKDIFLELLTFNRLLQPILMFIAGDEDTAEVKDHLWPLTHQSFERPAG